MATTTTTPFPTTPTSYGCNSKLNKIFAPTSVTFIGFRSRRPNRAFAGQLEPVKSTERPAEEGDVIRRLQNGPDVRGVALEGEKGRAVDFTPQAVEAIAESFGEWVVEEVSRREGGGVEVRVSVGRDPRVSGPILSTAVFTGLGRAGCEVFDMGLATTPACFMSTVLGPFQYDASIMVWSQTLGVHYGTAHSFSTFKDLFGI